MNDLIPLELLSCGVAAEIAEVLGDPAWVGRLAELGLRHGSQIRMLQSGSPCILQIGGTRLSLRGDLAMQILVRPLALAS